MNKEDREAIIRRLECLYREAEDNSDKEALFYAVRALRQQNEDLEELKKLICELEEEKDDIDLNKTPVEKISWYAGFRCGMARALLRLNCFVKRREGDK